MELNETSKLQMELYMQDKPLQDIIIMREFEKKYLTFALEILSRQLKDEYVKYKNKDDELKKIHLEEYYGDFIRSSVSILSHNKLVYFQKRFVDLLHDKWNWNAYFMNLEISDFYIRWFFI
jgi:hypothetical protein